MQGDGCGRCGKPPRYARDQGTRAEQYHGYEYLCEWCEREVIPEQWPGEDTPDSPTSKLVELYVQTHGPATIDELHDELDLPRLTLYPVLTHLEDQGRIRKEGETVKHSTLS